ncbi:hypothetical protein C8D77_12230 [Mesorhizobium loti]|uniref:Uncharacterized protein n=1 Tax=Rhizobium loti TaxID=381 RepID=A0A8E2W5X0_RHILI|nr:hypothetical protein C8D77_12230 [Mesorhizobium loti]
MGTFVDPSRTVDPPLQSYILGSLVRRRRGAVVSTNAIVAEIRFALPGCQVEDSQMAKFISEAAMLLGLVPVFDPAWKGDVSPGADQRLPWVRRHKKARARAAPGLGSRDQS